MPERRHATSGAPWEATVGYSRAVRVGAHVAVAGTTAVGPDGATLCPGDPYGQTRAALAIVERALTDVGASLGDVVRTRLYVTDIAHADAVGRAHGEIFGAIRPAATMVEVARLIRPDLLVEVEADALIA